MARLKTVKLRSEALFFTPCPNKRLKMTDTTSRQVRPFTGIVFGFCALSFLMGAAHGAEISGKVTLTSDGKPLLITESREAVVYF